jgi:hypothetical protein
MTRIPLVLLAVGALALVSPSRPQGAKSPPPPPLTKERVSGESLWKRFTKEDPYGKYRWWPGHEGTQPGQSPHGEFHRIYVHPVLADSLPVGGGAAPNGSIVVKCNLDADDEVKNFTVMAKVPGYDPAHNDWFWAMYDPEGAVLAQGRVQGCIDCHDILRSNDFLIVHRLNK